MSETRAVSKRRRTMMPPRGSGHPVTSRPLASKRECPPRESAVQSGSRRSPGDDVTNAGQGDDGLHEEGGDLSPITLPDWPGMHLLNGELRVLQFQLCKHCKEDILRRLRGRPFRDLTTQAMCPRCEKSTIRNAFHNLCEVCAGHLDICSRCGQEDPVERARYHSGEVTLCSTQLREMESEMTP